MLFLSLIRALRKRPPVVTFTLIFAAAITTLPQFFLPSLYDTLTGTLLGFRVPHFLFLSIFSHSPGILVPHFIGNLIVLLLFGTASELLLGPRRYTIISLVSLAVTLVFSYWRGLDSMHGISGLIWGYHVPVLLSLIVYFEHLPSKQTFLKDVYVLAVLIFFFLDFIGLHLLEVIILDWGFFENFGQVLHLISVITVLPFTFIWRKQIETHTVSIVTGSLSAWRKNRNDFQTIIKCPVFWILGAIIVINTAGTIDALAAAVRFTNTAEPLVEHVSPPVGSPIHHLKDKATITFSRQMFPENLELRHRSIWYEKEPVPSADFEWKTPSILQVTFERNLEPGERVKLRFDVYWKGPKGIPVRDEVELNYGDFPEK